jgi:hypothetical protein
MIVDLRTVGGQRVSSISFDPQHEAWEVHVINALGMDGLIWIPDECLPLFIKDANVTDEPRTDPTAKRSRK